MMESVDTCVFYEMWNAYHCQKYELSTLMFESLDSDKWDRSYTPLTLNNLEKQQTNVMNQFMDHVWDGFYTGQLRLNRFISIFENKQSYELLYTGTVPSKQRFYQYETNGGSIIRINYLKNGAFRVTDGDGVEYPPNDFDDATQ
mmetsp:Transcript_29266/g.28407  ORF Transcript_29266/g.28407 Transcript_29266/m.28407 type:complete len:144 (-) Transcript_29266:222-653(-)